ncbi:MAG: hypothetical protein SGJ18_02490 [Pseudomonadota bacterium]|nr:hypothetical protein [Pseudomonadota bacterium]
MIILVAAPSPAASYKETLVISQFQVQLQGVRYKIDDLLNITTVRKYTFSILPELALLNDKKGEPTKRLPDGPYLVRLTLFKGGSFDDLNAKQFFVDSHEKVASALGGRIVSDFEFDIRDLMIPGARNTLAVEIYPINNNTKKTLQPKLHLTQFVPATEFSPGIFSSTKTEINKQNPQLFMSNLVADARLEQKKTRAQMSEVFTVPSFAKDSGLELISLTEKTLPYNLDAILLKDLITQGLINLVPNSARVAKLSELAAHLCQQAYVENLGFWKLNGSGVSQSQQAQYQQAQKVAFDCRQQPFKYFDFDQKVHIKHIDPNVRYLGGSSQNFNVTSNFELNANHALSASLRESATAGVTVGVRLLKLFRTGAGIVPLLKDIFNASVDYTLSQDSSLTDSLTQNRGHSVSFSRGLYLIEQQASFEIVVTEYTPCISILAKEEILRQLFEKEAVHVLPFKGFHICGDSQTQNISVAETYYFFSQHFASGDLLDSRSFENRPFVMALRGVRDYFVFLNVNNAILETNDLTKAESEKPNPKGIVMSGMGLFSHQQRAYPGIYSTVTKPSQLQFLSETSLNSKAKEFFSGLNKTLSPWTRKDLQPLENRLVNR